MNIEEIQKFFFKAMKEGWAANGKKFTIPALPNYKGIEFRSEKEDLRLLDFYCVTPNSSKSAGTTTIWHKDIPVWLINYGGFYKECAIPFLKNALQKTIEKREFLGGRGPLVFVDEYAGLVYFNNPVQNDFSKFYGHEQIFDILTENLLGYHDYWGFSML